MSVRSAWFDTGLNVVPPQPPSTPKSNWREAVLEEGLYAFVLLSIGFLVLAVKVGPIILRWARGS